MKCTMNKTSCFTVLLLIFAAAMFAAETSGFMLTVQSKDGTPVTGLPVASGRGQHAPDPARRNH